MAQQQGSRRSDLLQILMLTLYLCSLFFAAWGGYVLWKTKKFEKLRKREVASMTNLQKELRKQESRNILINWKRRQESKGQSSSLQVDVKEVLDALGGNAPPLESFNPVSKKEEGGVPVSEAVVKLGASTLRNTIYFLRRLEDDKPHIRYKRLKVIRAKGKKDEDAWKTELTLFAYRGQ